MLNQLVFSNEGIEALQKNGIGGYPNVNSAATLQAPIMIN